MLKSLKEKTNKIDIKDYKKENKTLRTNFYINTRTKIVHLKSSLKLHWRENMIENNI